MSESVYIVLSLVFFALCLLSFAVGYLVGKQGRGGQRPRAAPTGVAAPEMAKQWENFFNYDGTERGQVEFEE